MKQIIFALAIVIGSMSSSQAASINGYALRFEWIVGDFMDAVLLSDYDGNYTVGTEYQTILRGDMKIGVSDNQVRFEWLGTRDYDEGYTFNGLLLTDFHGDVPDFLHVQQAGGTAIPNVVTSFDSESLFIDFGATGVVLEGSTAVFEFRLSDREPDRVPAVPLPATLPLLLAGLGGCAALKRRRNG